MPKPLSDQDQSNLGLAALVACVVQTLDGGLESFQARFEKNLEKAYRQLEDVSGADYQPAMEILIWTREFFHERAPQPPK